MKGRVLKYSDGFWYGETYGVVLGREGWWPVTEPHFIRLGAIIELKHFLKQQKTYYVDV